MKIMWRRMVGRRGCGEDCEQEELKIMWRRRKMRIGRMWERWRGEGRWWRGGERVGGGEEERG